MTMGNHKGFQLFYCDLCFVIVPLVLLVPAPFAQRRIALVDMRDARERCRRSSFSRLLS